MTAIYEIEKAAIEYDLNPVTYIAEFDCAMQDKHVNAKSNLFSRHEDSQTIESWVNNALEADFDGVLLSTITNALIEAAGSIPEALQALTIVKNYYAKCQAEKAGEPKQLKAA